MKIITKATNITLTNELSEYLSKRIQAVEKYISQNDESVIMDIEIGKTTKHHRTGDIFKAEATISGKGLDVRVEVEREDLRTAIDVMRDELVETLQKKKNKRESFLRRSSLRLKNMLRGFGERNK